MMKRINSFIILLFCFYFSYAQINSTEIDWKNYMQLQSPHWDSISTDYYTGILLGNGRLGTNIYKENDKAFRFDIGRSDVTDQRPDTANGNELGDLLTRARLPIGKMIMHFKGKIIAADMQLDLYNAVAKGTIFTSLGSIHFNAVVPTGEQVIVIKAEGIGEEENIQWEWVAEKSISPRVSVGRAKPTSVQYPPNPSEQLKDSAGYSFCYQPLLFNGEYSTVWKQTINSRISTFIIAVGYSAVAKSKSTKEAIHYIENYKAKKQTDVQKIHENWWHHYFQQSFVSIPDGRMEGYYWQVMYNLAAATRKGMPMVDLVGPWATANTPWPAIWWNLNTQLAYSPVFTSNHLEIGESLFDALKKNERNLSKNVPEEWQYEAAAISRTSGYDLVSPVSNAFINSGHMEAGNLTWTVYYYYKYFQYSKDKAALKEHIYPLLKKSVNFLLHLLQKNDNGIYHMVKTHSPEYADVEDANYSLSALRWGLRTLIQVDSLLKLKDQESGKWKEVLEHLVPYPANEDGFMIGKDKALSSSHRHFSHLLMIYPYREFSMEDVVSRNVIEKSITHWQSMPNALAGYSYVGASSMYSMLGRGNDAYTALNKFIVRHGEANCLYRESGPCFETPMAMANSLLEMLLQSKDSIVNVFPSIPDDWKNVSFKDLRGEGAILVSANRRNGCTEFIRIKSETGGNVLVSTDIPASQIKVTAENNTRVSFQISIKNNLTIVKLSMKKGVDVLLEDKSKKFPLIIAPVQIDKFNNNYWGLQKENTLKRLKEKQELFPK